MNVTTIGLDLAKSIFQVHGVDAQGKVVVQKKVNRSNLLQTLSNLGPAIVGMEACAGSHYWAREITKLGHTVRIMNPIFVVPYIKNQKNDANDAEGICEAVSRPNMRFVPHKSIPQQDMQSLHRAPCIAWCPAPQKPLPNTLPNTLPKVNLTPMSLKLFPSTFCTSIWGGAPTISIWETPRSRECIQGESFSLAGPGQSPEMKSTKIFFMGLRPIPHQGTMMVPWTPAIFLCQAGIIFY